jgi:uncharacterized metal-binding protein YceD (DUF177 family)
VALTFNIHRVEDKTLSLKGELGAPELEWDTRDEMIQVTQPLRYDLQLQQLGKSILAQGSLVQALDCVCVRCLKAFTHELKLAEWSCLLELEGDEKVTIINDCVDLTPYIREDIFLAFPQNPVCGPQCDGLAVPQRDEKPGASWESSSAPSVWADLDKLKLE